MYQAGRVGKSRPDSQTTSGRVQLVLSVHEVGPGQIIGRTKTAPMAFAKPVTFELRRALDPAACTVDERCAGSLAAGRV